MNQWPIQGWEKEQKRREKESPGKEDGNRGKEDLLHLQKAEHGEILLNKSAKIPDWKETDAMCAETLSSSLLFGSLGERKV